jgi:hypothetical protein
MSQGEAHISQLLATAVAHGPFSAGTVGLIFSHPWEYCWLQIQGTHFVSAAQITGTTSFKTRRLYTRCTVTCYSSLVITPPIHFCQIIAQAST